jgi:hypothetical protein
MTARPFDPSAFSPIPIATLLGDVFAAWLAVDIADLGRHFETARADTGGNGPVIFPFVLFGSVNLVTVKVVFTQPLLDGPNIMALR